MLGHVGVARLGLVGILHQVVPEVPFPDDFARGLAGGLDLNQAIGLQVLAHRFGSASSGDGFLGRLPLPGDQEHVAVGQARDVVVGELVLAGELVVPNDLAIPSEFLNPPPRPRAAEGLLIQRAGPQQVPILEQVGAHRRATIALPRSHHPPLHVDQVGLRRGHRREQGVALEGLGIVDRQPQLGRRRLGRRLLGRGLLGRGGFFGRIELALRCFGIPGLGMTPRPGPNGRQDENAHRSRCAASPAAGDAPSNAQIHIVSLH